MVILISQANVNNLTLQSGLFAIGIDLERVSKDTNNNTLKLSSV